MKKSMLIIFSLLLVFSFTACNKTTDNSENTTTSSYSENITETKIYQNNTLITTASDSTKQVSSETTELSENAESNSPELWSKKQIIDFYRESASNTHSSVKTQHKIDLKNISVNNGEYENVFNFITPIMGKLLANNSSDKDGITGGYKNLTENDVASAKAYKSGKNTVVELVMKKQVSGANEDALSGSVGHAITAVGDISVVTKQLEDLGLPLEIPEKNVKIIYTNPTVKVVINENGKIINGTWKYTVEINMNNYKAFGKPVDTTSIVMDNILTLNGGFQKIR